MCRSQSLTHDGNLLFCQILAIELKVTTVQLCSPQAGEEAWLTVSLQALEPMLPTGTHLDHAALANLEIDVFIFSDDLPHELDWGKCAPKDRQDMMQWMSKPSSVGGCISCLHQPQPLRPPVHWDLMHGRMPTLSLLDALRDGGWVGEARIASHNMDAQLVFDNRNPLTKKSYFKCLLVRADLFAAGIVEFRSGQPKTFYDYILRYRKLPPDGKSMRALRKELDSDDMVPDAFSAPIAVVAVPVPVHDDDIAIDEPIPVPIPLPLPDRAPSPVPSPPSPDPAPIAAPLPPEPDVAPDDEEGEAHGAAGHALVRDDVEWPHILEGCKLYTVAGRTGDRSYHPRLGTKCTCCGTTKTRSTQLKVEELGPKAALAFLGSWLQKAGTMPPAQHKLHAPSMADMREYKARHLA